MYIYFVYFRLTNLNGIEKYSKNKVTIDNEDNSNDTDITPAKNTSLKVSPKILKNEVNKLENINQFLSTIDGTDSGIYKSVFKKKSYFAFIDMFFFYCKFKNVQLLINVFLTYIYLIIYKLTNCIYGCFYS